MGLSGSQVAYRWAIADEEPRGKTRADTTRSGHFFKNDIPIAIAGAVRRGVIQSSIRIDRNTGGEPHRASFDFKGGSGFVPQPGHEVIIGYGTIAKSLFAGRVTTARRMVARNDDRRPVYRCDASGYLFDLSQARIAPGFAVQSIAPRSLVQRILGTTSPNASSMGFTADLVSATLPRIGEFTTGPGELVTDAMDRIFRAADAVWYVDDARRVVAFATTNPATVLPATITSAAAHVWGVTHEVTDLSRIFTVAHVFGAGTPSLADWDPMTHRTVPVDASSMLALTAGSTGDDFFLGTTENWVFDGVAPPLVGFFYTPRSQFNVPQTSVFLPAARAANTLMVVGANVSSVSPIDPERWYDISGQMIYVSSTIGVASADANSIAYAYWVPTVGSGAIGVDINQFADMSAPFQLTITSPTLGYSRTIKAGTMLRIHATRTNTPGVNAVSSLYGSSQYGAIARSFDDERLSPQGAIDVALSALERGDPAQWTKLEFTTRESAYDIGAPVYVSMTSPAEPSGNSLVGAFVVQDMTIGGFGRLTPTQGPERTIQAGAVRRPTLWQVLQGDR